MWNPTEKELQSVLRLPPQQRFEYAIKRMADCEEVWYLGFQDGWLTCGDEAVGFSFPIWPHREYAKASCIGSWSDYEPRCFALQEFMDIQIPKFKEAGHQVLVFPSHSPDTGEVRGVTLPAEDMHRRLTVELENYR